MKLMSETSIKWLDVGLVDLDLESVIFGDARISFTYGRISLLDWNGIRRRGIMTEMRSWHGLDK